MTCGMNAGCRAAIGGASSVPQHGVRSRFPFALLVLLALAPLFSEPLVCLLADWSFSNSIALVRLTTHGCARLCLWQRAVPTERRRFQPLQPRRVRHPPAPCGRRLPCAQQQPRGRARRGPLWLFGRQRHVALSGATVGSARQGSSGLCLSVFALRMARSPRGWVGPQTHGDLQFMCRRVHARCVAKTRAQAFLHAMHVGVHVDRTRRDGHDAVKSSDRTVCQL